MEKKCSHMTERILDLTLEIIYLLNGENYIALKLSNGLVASNAKKKQSPIVDPTTHAMNKNYEKVQEVTGKIIKLLMGEVPIRCRDATSCFSMEKWEYLEGHKDLYKNIMMEKWPSLTSPDGSRNRNTPERCPQLLDSQDYTQKHQENLEEHQEIPQDEKEALEQMDNRAEAKDEVDNLNDELLHKEDHFPEISSGPEDIEWNIKVKEEEELEVRQIKIEDDEIPLDYGMDGQPNGNNQEDHGPVSPGMDDGIRHSPGQHPLIPNLHPVLPSADISDTSTLQASLSGQSYTITPHTDHRSGEMFPCFVCGRFFTQKAILISHQRNHTLEGPFLCSVCGKCFSRKAYFIDHERTHTGERPYSCPVCGKCFNQKSALATHKRIHTAERPYPCSECGRCFTQKAHLIIHQRIHTGEKPYSCSECGKCFNQRSSLVTHQRIHTGEKRYPCLECGKCFSQLGTLSTHQRIHTGEKPYACTDCGKCFTRRTYLTDHQKTHTGEKPFSCSECGRCFSRKTKLIDHQRTHIRVKS